MTTPKAQKAHHVVRDPLSGMKPARKSTATKTRSTTATKSTTKPRSTTAARKTGGTPIKSTRPVATKPRSAAVKPRTVAKPSPPKAHTATKTRPATVVRKVGGTISKTRVVKPRSATATKATRPVVRSTKPMRTSVKKPVRSTPRKVGGGAGCGSADWVGLTPVNHAYYTGVVQRR